MIFTQLENQVSYTPILSSLSTNNNMFLELITVNINLYQYTSGNQVNSISPPL